MRVFALFLVFILHSYILLADVTGFTIDGGWEFILKTPAWAGVWIFILLGGYLAGLGFFKSRYEYSSKGIIRYYLTRLVKIIIPTFFFIILVCLLAYPSFFLDNPEALISMLTFRYNGIPGVVGIGATWYVFTIFWLYLITPFLCLFIDFIDGRIKNFRIWYLVFISIVLIGAFWRFIAYPSGDWYRLLYTNPLSNIDLWLCGIVLYKLIIRCAGDFSFLFSNRGKIFSSLLVIIAFLTNCYLYCWGDLGFPDYIRIYCVYYPSVWLLVVSLYIVAFSNQDAQAENSNPQKCRNHAVLINFLAGISFEFYLWHSIILNGLRPYALDVSPLLNYVVMILLAFVITVGVSFVFRTAFDVINGRVIKSINHILKD